MEKIFNYSIEKKKPITEEEVIALGWKRREGANGCYEKDNYWLIFHEKDGYKRMSIIAIDPTQIEWMPYDPENFRVVLKHPTLEAFKVITAFI